MCPMHYFIENSNILTCAELFNSPKTTTNEDLYSHIICAANNPSRKCKMDRMEVFFMFCSVYFFAL